MNLIPADFSPEFRADVVFRIKRLGGPHRTLEGMLEAGFHPSFARALVRSIMRREGW